jgi:hypothetical protein
MQSQLEDWTKTYRVFKKETFLVEVESEGMTLLKSTEHASQYMALFTKTYQELFNKSPEFRL